MPSKVHGTRTDPAKHHLVFDIRHWEHEFPLGDERRESICIDSPGDLAKREQAIRLAKSNGDLGPSVPSDIFVWSDAVNYDKPWLTRIGGRPWREKQKPWPTDADGVPLHFLGQICFADSKDILPFDLPGDVALIYGRWYPHGISTVDGCELEWSPINLKEPLDWSQGWSAEIPFCRQGVIHRTVQYTNHSGAIPAFKAAGWESGGLRIHSTQATCIATRANLPQGWPFETPESGILVAVLSSSYFVNEWPLVDVPHAIHRLDSEGRKHPASSQGALCFGIGDAGAIWIYRDRKGKFHLDEACG